MYLFKIVPEQTKILVERMGKFHRIMEPGFHWMIPVFDQISHEVSLKEQMIRVDHQHAITQDNVALTLDGAVFFRVEDPTKAAYEVASYHDALKLLAMTSMRSELGKIQLNNVFRSRQEINERIRKMLEETTKTWGIHCDRYEILRIDPPLEVRKSMQLQSEAERTRRKDIILSEAEKEANINIAQGHKTVEILKAEAEAQSIEIKAQKEKEGMALIAKTIAEGKEKGVNALDYLLKMKYYENYGQIIKDGDVTILPDSKGGEGSSSDVLAAVSMMMSGIPQKPVHTLKEPQTSSTKTRKSSSSPYDTHSSQSEQSSGSDSANWKRFFGNSKLD